MRFRLPIFIFSLLIFTYSAHAQLPQKIFTLAGNGYSGFGGDGSNASGANLWGPIDVALDGNGNVYVCDHFNYRVRKINTIGLITTIAGNGIGGYTGNGSIGSSAELVPRGLAVDKANNLYISDDATSVIRKINNLGIISTFAGLGLPGYAGDGGQAAAARFTAPSGMTFDRLGNLYIADMGNHVVRKIDTAGRISTVAGNHVKGYSGNGGPATAASLDSPYAVAVDRYGNLYIDDYGNNIIRKVDTGNNITKYVGKAGVYGFSGDGGLDTSAVLNEPRGLAVDTAGNLYISDANNNVVRMVSYSTGIISTVAGNGTYGFGGDLGFATGCNLFNPYGLAVDAHGSLYIADANNERVRKTYYASAGVTNVCIGAAISVYPNPASGAITVGGVETGGHVEIYDIFGRQMAVNTVRIAQGFVTVDMAHLAAGMYVVKVIGATGNFVTAQRIVKQ